MHTRHQISHRLIASRLIVMALASGAAVAAMPAWAHPDEADGNIAGDAEQIVYEERAVVQPIAPPQHPANLPATLPVTLPANHPAIHGGHHPAPHPSAYPGMAMWHGAHPAQMAGPAAGPAAGIPIFFPQTGYPHGAVQYPGQYPAQIQHGQIGREEWLAQCRARYYGNRGERRGTAVGGLLGAAAGGLIGNRIAGRGDRLVGTVAGAGLGAVVGAVAGSAIGSSADQREAMDECEAYLGQYTPGHRQITYGYGPVTLVPVMIPVPQRAVVREYVTEEWVEEKIMVPAPAQKIIKQAPAPKRVKTQPVRSVKSVKGS